jgi:imidazolonepropionase-like amidohydrolase
MRDQVRSITAILAVALLASCASAGARDPTGPDGALVLQGGWLFDGVSGQVVPNRGIVIQDSLLLQVNVALAGASVRDAQLIQLGQDDYVIPGMFDLHAHYAIDLVGAKRVDEDRVYPALFLANGVTSTFSAGEVNPEKMRELRLRIERGEQVGPRLFNSGPYFGDARPGWDPTITPEQIEKEVDYWAAQGAQGFKAKGIEAHHLEALIRAAHRHGLTVTGHLGSGFRGSVNPRDAILMGIDRIEHFEGGDAMTADRPAYSSLVEMHPGMEEYRRIVELYKERGVFFNATLSAYGYYGGKDPEVYTYFAPEMDYLTPYARTVVESRLPRRVNEQFERIYWVKRDLIKRFYELGGGDLITLGTDHPSWGEYFSGFSAHRELHTMVLAGIPERAALQIATINGARALRVDDRLGTIEPGKLADLVVIRGNPLEDIRSTRNVRMVIKNGTVYDPQQLLASVKSQLGPRSEAELADW